MHILVVNSGSSSIKFSIFDTDPGDARSKNLPTVEILTDPHLLVDGEIRGVGDPDATMTIRKAAEGTGSVARPGAKASTLVDAANLVFDAICVPGMPHVQAVGYRVVHPGAKLFDHQRITFATLDSLKEAARLAPLHDPAVVAIISRGMERFPTLPHYACFDTVFHTTMPEEASTYAIPREYAAQGVRRYGFHGLSCESIVRQMRHWAKAQGENFPSRMAIAHLGSGCSVTAVLDGHSVDTTMGLTPTGGVVMGTRSGDLDPGVVLYLLRQQEGALENATGALESLLNRRSGIAALSAMPNDLKAVREAAGEGNMQARLALRVFARSVTKAIGGFSWLLGGLDAIAFAGGIGENDPLSRAEILGGLKQIGLSIDPVQNQSSQPGLRKISDSHSITAAFVVPAQETLMIALHVERLAQSGM